MWWKKLLYFILVFVLGFGITFLSGSIAFNSISKTLVSDAVAEEKYLFAESFFNYVTPIYDSAFFYNKKQNGSRIDVYPALVKQPYFKYVDGKGYQERFTTIEEALNITVFNLPKDFKLKDEGNSKGGVKLFLNNAKTIDIYYDSEFNNQEDINYHINFYNYVEHYASLTAYITYDDFITHGGDNKETLIEKIQIIDGSGKTFYEMAFNEGTYPSFNNQMHNHFFKACKDYRDYVLEFGEAISVTTFERKQARLDVIDKIAKDNQHLYATKPSTTIVYGTNAFLLTISLTIAIYLSIAIVITRIIFFKRKRSAVFKEQKKN